MDRALESSRFSLSTGQDRRQLLSKRVTTAYNFINEICARRNKDTSDMQLPTGIPVPLYPGETLQQYTRKFEYWLGQRAQSLAKLRNDPSRERNFWFSFAYQRAESISEKKRSIPSNPCNNLCYEEEIKRVRLEERLQVVTSGSAMTKEELSSNISLSTRAQPTYDGLGLPGSQTTPVAPQRSRKEVLAQRILPPEEFLQDILERRQNRTPHEPPLKLREIPVPLYPGETLQDYEKEFRCWVYKHHESIKSLRSQPMKERGFRCQFALEKVKTKSSGTRTGNGTLSEMDRFHAQRTYDDKMLSSLRDTALQSTATAANQYYFLQSDGNLESNTRQIENMQNTSNAAAQFGTEIRAHSTAGEGHFPVESNGEQVTATSLPDSLPDWAVELIDRVEGLERQAMLLQREVRDLQTAASSQSESHGDMSCTKPSDMESDAGKYPKHIESVNNEADEKKGTNDVNYVVYPEDLTSSTHISAKDNYEMRRLAKEYCCLANQVTVNEVAMDDALNYFKEANGVDGYQAIDRRNRIMTLVISINQEKRKRSGALVDLLIHEWCGEEEKLLSILQEDLATTLSSKAQHDKLVEISLRLEEKYAELDRLEAQFSEQVQLVSTFPPSVTEAGKALRLKKLREVSGKILEEQTERDLLKKSQRDVLLCFVRGDDQVRKMMEELLLQTRHSNA
ncbi:hypothetical protein GN244_ATG19551 [Phytophthora infestans]|uniref:Uncharacterized protein n=1 Tax=Phytophthora infestans TaxID=4787 RepID=A0A833RNI0_PHYIN|nr:hypothetical protein GN244_ATG19551 [Phytophthora infestans]